jgi:hypothetical protein
LDFDQADAFSNRVDDSRSQENEIASLYRLLNQQVMPSFFLDHLFEFRLGLCAMAQNKRTSRLGLKHIPTLCLAGTIFFELRILIRRMYLHTQFSFGIDDFHEQGKLRGCRQ